MKPLDANAKKLIALVEPDQHEQLELLKALKDQGIHNPVIIFNDGDEALEHYFPAVAKGEGRRIPGLLLVSCQEDKSMEILKRFKGDERLRRVPVVILKSPDGCSPVMNAYMGGAASIINSSNGSFEETAQVLSEYWLKICRLPGN